MCCDRERRRKDRGASTPSGANRLRPAATMPFAPHVISTAQRRLTRSKGFETSDRLFAPRTARLPAEEHHAVTAA